MNEAYKLSLVIDQIKTASVIFEEGPRAKQYTYLTVIEDLKEGDEVIVETGASDALKVATVVSVHEEPEIEPNAPYRYRWILSTAGTTARREQERLQLLEKQALAIMKSAERKEAKRQVRERLVEIYGKETLSKIDCINFRDDQPQLEDGEGDPNA